MKVHGCNVPSSWRGMTFTAKMDYLVDTHQASDHKAARKILCDHAKANLPSPAEALRIAKAAMPRLPWKDDTYE